MIRSRNAIIFDFGSLFSHILGRFYGRRAFGHSGHEKAGRGKRPAKELIAKGAQKSLSRIRL